MPVQNIASRTAERAERAEGYLKLLGTLRAASSGAELGVVRQIATWIDAPEVLLLVADHAAWFDDWQVKEALLRNDATPDPVRSRCAQAVGVLDLLRELDDPAHSEEDKAEIREHVRRLIRALPEADREVVKSRALELSASRGGPREAEPSVAPAPPARAERAPEAVTPAAAEEESEPAESPHQAWAEELAALAALMPSPAASPVRAHEPVNAVSAEAPAAPTPAAVELHSLPLEERIRLARTSRDPDCLAVLAAELSDEVQIALIENPAAGDRLVATLARKSSPRVAREIYRSRRLFHRPAIRSALLESPHVPSAALVEVVSSMGDLRGLLGLTQNPQIKSLEVKSRARARLTALFRSLPATEKLNNIRNSGRPLLRALWTDFFRDEELVLRCLEERQLDPGLVLEIARSSIAPRRALQLIGETPGLSANYQVRLALARNPKTPRPVTQRVLKTLRPADRQMLEREAAAGRLFDAD